MAVIIKSLYSGLLMDANLKELYTPAAGRAAIIKSVRMVNS